MTARRVQRRRGVALPPDTVYVGRPTKWGNPFRCEPTPAGRASAAHRYREWLADQPELIAAAHANLAGRNLSCWCPLDGPCHADVLLDLANQHEGGEQP